MLTKMSIPRFFSVMLIIATMLALLLGSAAFPVRVPGHSDHRFRRNSITDCDAIRSVIPANSISGSVSPRLTKNE